MTEALAAVPACRFVLPGPPQPKQRARKGKNNAFYTPAETVRYERSLAQMAALRLPRGWTRDGVYRVHVHAVFEDHRRRDEDNVLKAVQDGLNGVTWNDDSQIVDARITKTVEQGRPRTEVAIERIGDAPPKRRRRPVRATMSRRPS